MKKKTSLIIVIFLLIALIIAIFTLNYTKEGNALIATNFVKNESTYKFDGIPETFKLNKTITKDCTYCWEFYFEYRSLNSGYGDRKNTTLNPVLTNHSARITMEKGTINSAILDDMWDMNAQKFIESIRPTRGGQR